MSEHERTIMAFDDRGNEYIIDMFVSVRELSELQQVSSPRSGLPAFRTREGHPVTYLGGGEFSIRLPGEESVTVRTDDSTFS